MSRNQHYPICDNGDILCQEFFISIIVIIIKWLLCIVSFRTAIMGRPNKSNQKSIVFRWSYCLRASVHYVQPRIVWRCDETVCRQQRAAWPGSAVMWTHYFSSDIISIQVCQPALAAAGHVSSQPRSTLGIMHAQLYIFTHRYITRLSCSIKYLPCCGPI